MNAHDASADAGLLARSLALGVASGMRSTLGFNGPGLRGLREKGLTRANVGRLTGIGGELVVDKLPQTPSRLTPPGLIGRFASGAFGGVQLARRAGAPVRSCALAAVVGAAGAAGGAYGGAAWRRWVTGGTNPRPDWQGAVLEDAVALSLTAAACR